MGKVFSTDLEVHMEGLDEPLIVRADQRDYAAWEAYADGALAESLTTRLRFLAWNAAKRQGKVSIDFQTFNEKLCIQALIPQEDEPEPEGDEEDKQGLDPGRRTASGS